jgi:uncharacterized membrane protein
MRRVAPAADHRCVETRHWDTSRVEAFSDGVFAIAITLLVLDIHVEPSQYDDLRQALLDEWPTYLAYVTSFLTVGSVWLAHHNLYTQLRYVDPVLLRLNLLLLLVASFLPFPTGVLAESFDASDDAERTAILFYGATALLIELLLRAAVNYAKSKPELTHAHAEGKELPAHKPWREGVNTGVYSVAILLGVFIFPRLAALGFFIVAIRGVFVVGGEGRLSLRGLARPKR